ncbi:hypothetical protein V5799_031330 [Amblyomma americanum]|uniref:Uncharacterized protein n=1 Tax=Amblyomma americanum TaxID=6943 RepID=A0AAQ4EKQ0_AMBAM
MLEHDSLKRLQYLTGRNSSPPSKSRYEWNGYGYTLVATATTLPTRVQASRKISAPTWTSSDPYPIEQKAPARQAGRLRESQLFPVTTPDASLGLLRRAEEYGALRRSGVRYLRRSSVRQLGCAVDRARAP